MLRLQFRMPLVGVFATLIDEVDGIETVELDNCIPMCGGRALVFLTLTCPEACDVPAALSEVSELSVRHCAPGPEAERHHLLAAAAFEPSVLSTVVGEGAVPHWLVGDRGRADIDAVVSVDDWNQLRDLASAIETTYGAFELRGTTELERPGYPLGRDKFEWSLRGQLTADQVEVLRTAYEMGHFAVPQQATSEEVAAALDIGRSTLSERLRRAQNGLLRSLFSGPDPDLDGRG
jgi:hypothetical protein